MSELSSEVIFFTVLEVEIFKVYLRLLWGVDCTNEKMTFQSQGLRIFLESKQSSMRPQRPRVLRGLGLSKQPLVYVVQTFTYLLEHKNSLLLCPDQLRLT